MWIVQLLEWAIGNGYKFISKWKKFHDDNGLVKGDACLFEVTKRGKIKVTLFNN